MLLLKQIAVRKLCSEVRRKLEATKCLPFFHLRLDGILLMSPNKALLIVPTEFAFELYTLKPINLLIFLSPRKKLRSKKTMELILVVNGKGLVEQL